MNYQSLLDKYESQRSARENYEVLKSNEFVNSILEENKKLKKQVNDLTNLVKEIFEELKESKKNYEDKLAGIQS
jgi:protease II